MLRGCTSGDHCVAGRCMGGVVPHCGGGGPCSQPVCTPEHGWIFQPVADGSVCDDGDACSQGDVCVAGACVGGPAAVCEDGDPCTVDACDPVAGCVHLFDPAQCGGGPCCAPHPGPGCDDPDAASCVCAFAPECCDVDWMPHCVDVLRTQCGYPCGGGGCTSDVGCEDGDPCTADRCLGGSCQHEVIPGCGGGCTTAFDCQDPDPCTYDLCVAGACVHEFNPGCGAGPCCAAHPEPGCELPDVSQCVCAFAPECCTLGWLPHCVDVVQTVCGFPCFPSCQTNDQCDDGNGCTVDSCAAGQCQHDAVPGCGGGSCCATHPDPGCELPPVSDCVCGFFPHCCTLEWGPECVDVARSVCGLPCVGQCTDDSDCDDGDACTLDACDAVGACVHSIDPDCLLPGPCCEPHPGAGCADPVVSACVCAREPSCCLDWHPICADIARFECGADCASFDRDGDGWPAPADCDDLNPTVFPGAPERCNGRDDDCDGLLDEAPTDCPNGTTCMAGGCVGSCTPHTCAELGAQCGLQPDGCFGVIDCGSCGPGMTCDGLSCFPGECLPGMVRPCGVGACQGLELCRTEGLWGPCDAPPPSPEICDLQDNDCDGVVDEGKPCPAGATCVDAVCVVTGCLTDADCAAGTRCVGGVCQTAGDADQDGVPAPFDCDDTNAQTFPGAPEVCDGRDNDCDGVVDDGLQRSCYTGPSGTAGVGDCRPGTQTCIAGDFNTQGCPFEVRPTAEVCDGRDNDCDGVVDDACLP